LTIFSARLHTLAGEWGPARQQVEAVLQRLDQSEAKNYDDARLRAEAHLWAARAWRNQEPARALRHAESGAALIVNAVKAGDGNVSQGWMQALLQGERALALQALHRPEAPQVAQQAMQLWARWAVEGAPPGAFSRFIEPVRHLALP